MRRSRRLTTTGLATLGVMIGALALTSASAFAAGPPEAPVTEPVTVFTATTATFEGELNPGVGVGATAYRWAYTQVYEPGVECSWSGQSVPAEGPFPEVSGNKQDVSAPVSGLEGSSEYVVCLVAINPENGEEVVQGNQVSFKTLASKPLVVAQSTSGVTPFAATLQAEVNPENQATTCAFEYGETIGEYKTPCEQAAPLQGGPQTATLSLSGLTPGTEYRYRVVLKNATGEVKGTGVVAEEEFTTLTAEKPAVEGERVIGAALTSDTIEAQLNPEYQGISTCEVQYVTKAVYETTGFAENVASAGCSTESEFGQGGSPVPFTATLSGLAENTAYEYRVVAGNGTGTTETAPQALTRAAPRIVGAAQVTEFTQHTALIAPGEIAPEIEAPLEASYYVLYGTAAADEMASAHVSAGSGLTANAVGTVQLYELQPGTTYRYAVVVYNGNATVTGPEGSFTTASEPPITTPPAIGTQSAQFVNEDSAVIAGELNPEGLETTYEVQYGTSTAYGSSLPGAASLAPFTSAQGTITSLTSLAPGTVYHYRIVATNQAGTSYGQDETLTTSGTPRASTFTNFPVPTVPQIAVEPFAFPSKAPVVKESTKVLTRVQKLSKALKACRKKPGRAACERRARSRYGKAKAKPKGKKK